MKFLYNAIYLLLLIIGLPWIVWRVVVQGKNRTGWKEKIFGLVPERTNDRSCIWIHAVSVGEVNLLPKLVERLKAQHPDVTVAISSTTETGLKLAAEKFPGAHVFFCPADFSWAINNALDRIAPEMLILTELELWPNLISLTSDRDIPVALINGRVSEPSYRGYHLIRFLIELVVRRIDVACVQTADYRQRLLGLGMPSEKISVTGNIKFDNAVSNAGNDRPDVSLNPIADFAPGSFVFVGGSTLEVEDLMLIDIFDAIKEQYPQLRLVLVPRHPARVQRIAGEIRRRGLSYSLRSNFDGNSVGNLTEQILIVDVIGELTRWWQIASAGFVGGSMGSRGGQNMIEPAAIGIPICFGPDTANFQDVVRMLLQSKGAHTVDDQSELRRFVEWAIGSPKEAAAMADRAREAVLAQQGALQQTLDALVLLMNARNGQRDHHDSRNAA